MASMESKKREQYELDLKLDILGDIIKRTPKERNLTLKVWEIGLG